jgi:protein O-mannosyl-transferase
VPLIIIAGTLILYQPSLDNGILHGWDDALYLGDKDVQALNAGNIFGSYHLGMYQPLAVLTLAMNHAAGGEAPGPYHATNLFLHALNIFLAWLFLYRLSQKQAVAGIGALLFAVHPVNVEAVAWLSARSTLLFTAFYLGGLICYLRWLERAEIKMYILSLLLALGALFSKSLAMSFPLVLFAIDYMKGRRPALKPLLEKVPFLALAVVFGIITIDAAGAYGHIKALEHDYSFVEHFFILCHTWVFYLIKFIAPVELSPVYAYPVSEAGLLPWPYYLSALVPAAFLVLFFRFRLRMRDIFGGLLIFTLAVLPVLPLFWSRVFVAADRYAYHAYTGLFLIAGILIAGLYTRLLRRSNKTQVYALAVILAAYVSFLVWQTNKQIPYWKDANTLLSRAVELSKTPQAKTRSFFYRGNSRQNLAEKKYLEGQATFNEGMIKNAFTFYREALSDYDSVMKYDTTYMQAYANRGMIYGTLISYGKDEYWEQARKDFDKAISLKPDYADNYYNKAWLLFVRGDTTAACTLWNKAVGLGSVMADRPLKQYCRQ